MSRRLACLAIALLGGSARLAAQSTPVHTPVDRAQLIGTWRLDSLAVYPLRGPADSLADSTRQTLASYEGVIRRAVAQFRSGDMTITTRYRDDSTFVHEVAPKGAPRGPTRERGRWSYDPATGQLRCRTASGVACPHDRARVERATADELILRLELVGRGTGLEEFFRLVRVIP